MSIRTAGSRPGIRSLAPLLLCSLVPGTALAQSGWILGGDAVVRSSSVWRGIPRTSRWVIQPDLFASAAWARSSITGGWWSTIELVTADPADPTNVGLGQVWFGQNDLWVEVAARSASADFTGGVTRYLFADGAFGQPADAVNTTELYATSRLTVGPLVPRLALWVDVDRVVGAYFETSVDLRVPVLPSYDPIVAVYLSALAGWSAGQEVNSQNPEEAAYFRDAGLTHLDFGLDVAVGRGQRYITVELHVLAAQDGGARSEPGPSGSESWWMGVGFSDSVVLGALW